MSTLTWPTLPAQEVVAEIAHTTRLLIALDFDGTLSPFVDDPMTARATPDARDVLLRVGELPDTEVALVSGRSLRDLREIAEHDDQSPVWLAGSHGAQFWVPGLGELKDESEHADAVALVQERLVARAEESIVPFPGVWIEHKAFGFAVAGRRAEAPAETAAFAAVDALMADVAPTWRRRRGHHILEFASRSVGKDAAIAEFRRRSSATAVLFAGDDVTDEDALESLHPDDLGIRVGEGDTAARVRVADIAGLVDLLAMLAERRALI